MKTDENSDHNKNDQAKTTKPAEAKVIPLQPTDSETLGDKITINADNEDMLTPVKDDKNDY